MNKAKQTQMGFNCDETVHLAARLPVSGALVDALAVVQYSSTHVALVCPGSGASSQAQLMALAMQTLSVAIVGMASPTHALVAPLCHITHTLARARSRVLVQRYDVLAAVRNCVPFHRIVIAQRVVLFDPHRASQYGSQPPQTEFLQFYHLINHQSVILK
jgi:hypothetical protein